MPVHEVVLPAETDADTGLASVVFGVVLVNAVVGFAQEFRAERALDALVALVRTEATAGPRGPGPTTWCPATWSCWIRATRCPPTSGWCAPSTSPSTSRR